MLTGDIITWIVVIIVYGGVLAAIAISTVKGIRVPADPAVLYAEAGDLVTCENGHPICEFVRDVRLGSIQNVEQDIGGWHQHKPTIGTTPSPCWRCGAKWWNGGAFHFEDGWRTGPKLAPIPSLNRRQATLERQVHTLSKRIDQMALDLKRLVAAASAMTSVAASAKALIETLKQQVEELRPQVPPDAQAVIDGISQSLERGMEDLVKAVTVNTIADPTAPYNRTSVAGELSLNEALGRTNEPETTGDPAETGGARQPIEDRNGIEQTGKPADPQPPTTDTIVPTEPAAPPQEGVAAQPGTPETDADPANPNERPPDDNRPENFDPFSLPVGDDIPVDQMGSFIVQERAGEPSVYVPVVDGKPDWSKATRSADIVEAPKSQAAPQENNGVAESSDKV